MSNLKVGLVGCGNIGADICIALQKGTIPAEVAALTDVDPSRARVLLRSFNLDAAVCPLDENAGMVDFLVECAGPQSVRAVLQAAIRHETGCLILSVGGLMEEEALLREARQRGLDVRIPSGALSGLDAVRAAVEGGLHSVVLTTRKPPACLNGAPYLEEHNIDLEHLEEPVVVFEGTAREAVQGFPQNLNVAASLSFAGVGPVETRVRVIADPTATTNIHEVVAEGAFGRLTSTTENLPSPRNAKSSYLASLSANAELRTAALAHAARQPEAVKPIASNS